MHIAHPQTYAIAWSGRSSVELNDFVHGWKKNIQFFIFYFQLRVLLKQSTATDSLGRQFSIEFRMRKKCRRCAMRPSGKPLHQCNFVILSIFIAVCFFILFFRSFCFCHRLALVPFSHACMFVALLTKLWCDFYWKYFPFNRKGKQNAWNAHELNDSHLHDRQISQCKM